MATSNNCGICKSSLIKRDSEKCKWLYCPKCHSVYDVEKKNIKSK